MQKAMITALCVCVCTLLCVSQAIDNPAFGVKLCGREFIRAVIFTCGGSRWRRSASNTAPELLPDSMDPSTDDTTPDLWLENPESAPVSRLGGALEGPEDTLHRDWSRLRPARSLFTDGILEALRTADRKGRDVVVGLSNACCKWGCSKSEISSLC